MQQETEKERIDRIVAELKDEKNIDKLVAELCGGICNVRITKTKWSDIAVGKKFWDFCSEKNRWRLIQISYIREPVAFFTVGSSKKEDYFDKDTLI